MFATLVTALAALGIAFATSALAQKQDAPKADAKKTEAPKADAKKAEAKPDAKAESKASSEPMDINSASEKELATLKGIGDVRAKAIVKHRPYKGKDDLVKKKVIPQGVYDDIKDQIIAKQDTAKKMDDKKADAPKKDEKKK
jgi:DNA uptake protein ComE-like DNA-binding protein